MSDKQQAEIISSGVDSLIARLRDEGVADGKKKADKFVQDAMKNDGNPGTVYRIPLGRCQSSQCIASMHGFDIFRVLALTGREVPPDVLVFGVEPSYIGWSMELSPPVTNALAFLLESVKKEIWGMRPPASPSCRL